MRKIVAGLFISLDGVVEAPGKWQSPLNDEAAAVITAMTDSSDAILLGRDTYLEFAEMWPKMGPEVPMSDFLNNSPKYVVTSTLKKADWANSTIVSGDLADVVAELKGKRGKNIMVPGSPRLVRSLLQKGLLDKLSLMVQPVVVGHGARLFDGLTDRVDLTLVDSSILSTGVVSAIYEPATKDGADSR